MYYNGNERRLFDATFFVITTSVSHSNPRPWHQYFLINAIILRVAQTFSMTFVLKEEANNFKEGYFGKVFFQNDYAIKIFRRPAESSEGELSPIDITSETNRRMNKFHSEVLAYQRALCIEELRPYVSHFRGIWIISRVYDIDNNDVSDQFLLDCTYAMDHLQGERKECGNTENQDITQKIQSLFRKYGINAMDDFSFFHDERANVAGIVDFAIEEFEAWHT